MNYKHVFDLDSLLLLTILGQFYYLEFEETHMFCLDL